jgi:hypothetical protein
MPSPIPKARYQSTMELVARIDLKKAEVLRLRKTAENLERNARIIFQRHPNSEVKMAKANRWMESVATKRWKADQIESSYKARLKGKQQIISTALLPMDGNEDASIPK